ncbi:NAD(P)-dependent oxidoreductase [Enterococcus raffinosus]|uniref:NAD(P)-dependent oxidoreductase n=1 Tax=Enterococcus raffinosus TaxID=71452 RepID=A0AAW8T475_9ENTE|nr:NAD(P)-dependent oxidoreductase [Enterococcus raffinosus]MDT2524642.1 NAD(P)-dependent oxidoreductase [Enterococcus raffinosus]MDT2528801.1 NAD(P)-dependent oxidoreductase [Enterococcus raffinosus]MDT2535359.1 NAD(P)-dependent oxidoreductase [Enterococcus raffinosus]MDT2542795.1 NAD(P)-dependent oxidoreductase [Enterococcus raffinosus]MDT2553510.1 NAD(P)-dependent oxidoreductase [Enterococcus raffinosus]
MKIAIIGATGNAGSLILNEALSRDLAVTAIVRHPEKLKVKVPILVKDLFELTKKDVAFFDVVIDAFRPPNGQEELHQTSLKHLSTILQGTDTRLIVVGGASSLFIDEKHRMIDVSDPKAVYYPTAYNMYQAFMDLRAAQQLNWTYISPAANFVPNGARTGHYQISDDHLQKNDEGKSEISMADYAIAVIDEVIEPRHLNQHFSVYS